MRGVRNPGTLTKNNLAVCYATNRYGARHYGDGVRCLSLWESETHTGAIFAERAHAGECWHYTTVTAFKARTGGFLTGPIDTGRECTAMYAHEHSTALKRRGFRKVA